MIGLADGSTQKIKVARLMATLSADRPLGPKDFATHACDNPVCANPDHLIVGSASSNGRDKFRPGRPIRERIAARFYDPIIDQMAPAPPFLMIDGIKIGMPIHHRINAVRRNGLSLDPVPRFASREPCGKGWIALEAPVQHL
ncbi:hypothetical protein [Methylobacterium pseudosasicola]|uniref:hypothetical protein n=1 Tax=Methylobacterium pseudosasicola TaxID=582667 RepID=UPI000B8929F8|nr:hypothetical protein [Methylobacterium pseudosasicola]